ncbi:MAG: GAF domain-containing protein [Methylacidiphilales bacterium]|nr:GAF domain-containing protein [Candidatus Methylacidiphilales bacterium]NJR17045.1 GAF domain-containing protein [Calothrix sp. CSU_2_0]
MKQRFSSPLQNPDELDRIRKYPYEKLMQHQEEPAQQLAQKINQIVANTSSQAGMLQEIAQLLGAAFDIDCCCLVSVTGEISEEPIVANWCKPEYLDLSHPNEIFAMEPMDLPVVQCAAETLTINDISTIEHSLKAGCQQLQVPIKAVLAIPTRFAGKNNGVVSLIRSQPSDWSEEERELLKSLEASCAIAFSQVGQAQMIASQQQFVQTCAQHQSLIKQLSILSRSNLELNQMLQLVLTSTAEALQVDRGLLILLKYTDPLFRIRQKKQVPKAKATIICEWSKNSESYRSTIPDAIEETLQQSFLISDCGLCQRIFIDSGKPIIVSDITDASDIASIAPTATPLFALDKLPAMLLMPLENQGRILGFLVLQQAEPRTWQSAETNIVEMVCGQVSNSVIQSQTLRQVQMLVDERTAQLQRSLEVQAKLYEKTRQYVEQLRELNELKDEFLSNMSDRLRYPLTNMRMAIRNLRQPSIQADRQARYFDILEQECTKEINLINDLLTLQKLETHQERPQLENIDLNTRIQDLTSTFATKLSEKGINIVLELPPESLKIETELESFDRILQELLANATKYSQPDTTVYLRVNHQVIEQTDRVIIELINIGRGISEEEVTYIFDKFRRGKGRWTPGTGLGLALVKSLVQHLNGEITLASNQIEDSDFSNISFTLNLPQFSDEIKP